MLIFNLLNKWRGNSLRQRQYELNLKLIYLIRNVLGYLRALIICLAGKIKYQGSYRPLIIGAWTQLLIRPGCSIILKSSNEKIVDDVYPNNSVFLTASTIGTRPHYLALDPPSKNITRIELLANAELILEKNTIILSGSYISASNKAKIVIGENSYISQEVILNSRNSITIGRNVLVGYQVMMMDYNAHTVIYTDDHKKKIKSDSDNAIIIGDNVWIGARVTILKGVTIGSGSIIGANSCVTSDIPANVIAVGNPAKIIRNNITWQR